MLSRIAHFAYRRRKPVGVAALVFVIVAGAFGGQVQKRMSTSRDSFDAPNAPSAVAQRQLQQASGVDPEPDFVALVRNGQGIASAAGRQQVARVIRTLQAQHTVARVAAPFGTPPRLRTAISADGRATLVMAYFRPINGDAAQAVAKRIAGALAPVPGVTSGGPQLVYSQIDGQVKKDLTSAETIAFPVLFLLTLIIFRGLVAAALPLVIGAVSVIGTFAALRVVIAFTPLSTFAVNLVTGLGLGLAIDYSLFIVSRYREELAGGHEPRQALARTLSTAGRTVAFSSATVTLALLSLLVFPQESIYSMGIAGPLVALISGIAALTVLPAVLAMLGHRVNALSPKRLQRAARTSARPAQSGYWYRLASLVMRHPAVVALGTAAVLVAIGLPSLGVDFGRPDARVLPASASARQVSEQSTRIFGASRTDPIIVSVQGPATDGSQVSTLAASMRRLPGVASVEPPQAVRPGLWELAAFTRGTPASSSSQDAVRAIRAANSSSPFRVLVGGEPGRYVDQQASMGQELPSALIVLVGTTLIVLFAMTGSVVLPVKALLMNLLTLSATFGLLVLVFQDGNLQGPLAYSSTGSLEPQTMVLLFVLAFALTTDYGVFLLTRIKEARDAGRPNAEAVAHGLERTGRIVSAAALLLCVALGTFAMSKIVFIKELGLGAVCAIAVDAMLVRALLVPALMKLLGRWNWWAPPPLHGIARRFSIEA